MPFVVPKFIEMEPKIVGPFTFRQFVYVGLAGAICFILYFSLGKTNFLLFLLLAIILMAGAMTLAFLKIEGRSLPTILKNFLMFSATPKIYIWKKKALPPKIIKEKPKPKEKIKETPALKVIESKLKKLSTRVETRTK